MPRNRAQENARAGLFASRWPFLSFVESADSGRDSRFGTSAQRIVCRRSEVPLQISGNATHLPKKSSGTSNFRLPG
jgi:hypothetical protein